MARRAKRAEDRDPLEADLEGPPPELRWRDWMGRVEAVIFASPTPVPREALAALVGKDCNLDRLIEDIRAELVSRPYELVFVAGGYQHRTREKYADREEHRRRRWITLRMRKALGDLFLGPYRA
jgi:segregation and condensation protein B